MNLDKIPTGIPGFEHISHGGLPVGRTTLVVGSAGSGKTVYAGQFLAEGIMQYGQRGVFVTFEELPHDLRANAQGFAWPIVDWEREGKWAFVDASPDPEAEPVFAGRYDMAALLARIEHAIKQTGATRVAMDSLGAIFTHFTEPSVVRNEMFRIGHALKQMNVTAVLTAERLQEYGEIARFGIEEFVADNVIVLRNILSEEKRRRTIEILKYRGTPHNKGEYPFTILPERGIEVIPLSAMELKQRSSNVRIHSGSDELDKMCGGGFFRDSIVLVSGATGTGKTLMVTEFVDGGVQDSERVLLFAFEESRDQLFRNAIGWGVDFEKFENDGSLQVECVYPEVAGLEDHLIWMKTKIAEFKPDRVAVDSLSALERVSGVKGFREFTISLTSYIKEREVAGLFTSTAPEIMGGESVTERHISTITDTIVLLRYVELLGEMRRGLAVLKMRGSPHDKRIREFTIDQSGMHIGQPFRSVTGIIGGRPRNISDAEIHRLEEIFTD